jgi:tetratricopeptide (TPR) repeat protein/predicted Ser/Thr protein kinase
MSGAGTAPADLTRYRILRLLGRGGLGEVYLGHDDTLDRDVAIKFLSDPLQNGAPRRLLREARASAGLDHSGICAVYEVGETSDGRAFIVMQYVRGETLERLLERGPMNPVDALRLAARIASALSAAHRKGVVHRDLKPGNVMITPDGRPMLVDFGIARSVATESHPSDVTATMTSITHGVIGTPAYMSPEQIQERPLDGRSDLFALGLILFECLTGKRAFEGRSPIDTAAAVIHLELAPPSSVRNELTAAHDDLCRRLTAKSPDDRFQSAEEVIGAIRLLLPDTPTELSNGAERPRSRRPRAVWLAAALVIVFAGIAGTWRWSARARLPVVPPEARIWSDRGTEAIREGAYETGRKELEQSVALFPGHALGYARLAEAQVALDDPRAAQETLLRVSALVPDESRLATSDRVRVQAVRALVLRDVDAGVSAYRQLVREEPQDAGAWLDLGRALEDAGLLADAHAAYQSAIDRNRDDAAAYLRLGSVSAREGRPKDALSAFEKAEQLYQARSDIEGQTQVLLARGNALDLAGELSAARVNLERALHLATDSKMFYQQVRARLALSSISASQGRYAEAQQQAASAVSDALAQGLDATAAGGLVDLAATLLQLGQADQAETDAKRALDLAEQRGARMTAARARTQLASIYQDAGKPDRALALVAEVLPFFKASNARWSEVTALLIASRSHRQLDHLEQARELSSEVLQVAETTKDDAQIALAATNLASVTADLGDYPAALALRLRAEEIHRRLGDQASLPYDLTNRADLLVRLGRPEEAAQVLDVLDAGVAKHLDSYVARLGRARFARAMAAATALDCVNALQRMREMSGGPPIGGSAAVWAPAIADFCNARLHRPRAAQPSLETAEHAAAREAYYWRAAAALAARDFTGALAEARRGSALLGSIPNDELRWRLAAVAATAASQIPDRPTADAMRAQAREAIARLESAWGYDTTSYRKRADLVQLGKGAGLF